MAATGPGVVPSLVRCASARSARGVPGRVIRPATPPRSGRRPRSSGAIFRAHDTTRGHRTGRRSILDGPDRRRTGGLLDGINHVAWTSADVARLGRFYAEVFDAEVGPTRPHGRDSEETLTVIRLGPRAGRDIIVISGTAEVRRQTPMWGRGRIDHVGLQAASVDAFATIRQRLIDAGASDGTVNDFGRVHSMFFRDPDGLEGEVLVAKDAG